MADQAVCSRPVFFPFRSADVGVPKVAAAGASTAPFFGPSHVAEGLRVLKSRPPPLGFPGGRDEEGP
jgi:hypothetical protein